MTKRIFQIFLLLVIAISLSGCTRAPGQPKAVSDGGIYKSKDASGTWTQSVDVLAVKGQILRFPNENVNAIVFDPQDHNAVYAGTDTSGLLYSYDGGTSWTQDKFHKEKGIFSIAIDYYSKCHWTVSSSTRVYRTIDCGRGWKEVLTESREGYRLIKVLADHFNRSTVFVANSKEILKSTDYGDNWQTVQRFKETVTDITMDRFDSRIIFVTLNNGNLSKTVDGGATWVDVSAPIKEFKKTGDATKIVQDLSKRDTYILVNDYGLFRTIDSGKSWAPLTLLTPPNSVDIRSMAIDPKNGDVIYYATETTFYKSIDAGQTWKTSRLPTSRKPNTMTVDFVDSNVIYIGTRVIPKDNANQLIR